MSLYRTIRDLANSRNVSISRIERDVDIANGTLRKWDKSNPRVYNLQKVAKYLGVTTDDLLKRSDEDK